MSSIHFSIREEDLYEFFGEHNLKVKKLNILKNDKGQSKGSGFIEFETAKDANYAVSKLNGF
jgi:RNA recognition motif-containing protein